MLHEIQCPWKNTRNSLFNCILIKKTYVIGFIKGPNRVQNCIIVFFQHRVMKKLESFQSQLAVLFLLVTDTRK